MKINDKICYYFLKWLIKLSICKLRQNIIVNVGVRVEEESIILDKAEFIHMNMSLYYRIYILEKPPGYSAKRLLERL